MPKTKAQQALEFVQECAKTAPTGIDLQNAFFGNGGQLKKLFPTREEREAFWKTPQFEAIVKIQDEFDRKPKRRYSKR